MVNGISWFIIEIVCFLKVRLSQSYHIYHIYIAEKPLLSCQKANQRTPNNINNSPIPIVKWSPVWVLISKSTISGIDNMPDICRNSNIQKITSI